MLKLSAQGSRGIIVAVQLGAVKVYVATVEALRKKERQGETEETIKMSFLSFKPRPWMLMSFFCTFLLNLTLCMTKLGILTLSFPDFTDISIMWLEITETRVPPNSCKVLSRLFCIFCDGTCLFYVFFVELSFSFRLSFLSVHVQVTISFPQK